MAILPCSYSSALDPDLPFDLGLGDKRSKVFGIQDGGVWDGDEESKHSLLSRTKFYVVQL